MKTAKSAAAAGAAITLSLWAGSAFAQAMTTPAMSWPLAANAKPTTIDAGPLGDVYVTGAITGLGYNQNAASASDRSSRADMSNAQVFVQTTEGPVQFFAQFGAYSIPTIGVPYGQASDVTKATFGVVPQAFVKFVPNDSVSIMVGKLPTLIGAEYTFTFQNSNIQRGLLWNQENAVNRGVQVNYANGPVSISAAWNDGFYSGEYTWGSVLASLSLGDAGVVAFAAGANLEDATDVSNSATSPIWNNQEIYNLIYTYTNGPLTLMPYVQYNHVPKMPTLGIDEATTTGVALLGKYSLSDSFSLAARGEYIASDSKGGTTSLLYGADTGAYSFTVTPTWQKGAFFVRGELSYLKITDFVPGAGFGSDGNDTSQTRALIETGILF